MDTLADPATPLPEVYQAFFDDLALEGVMPVLQADDRIPKIGKPSDVAILLAACVGDRPEDLRDRAMVWLLYSSGVRADVAAQ